jgi:hypothetical protein
LAADEGAAEKVEPAQLRNEAPLNCVSLRSELDAARKKTSKVSREDRQNGVAVGRPSCQSSLLSDPNAKFSVEMWRKPQRTRKVKNQETEGMWT